MRQIGRDDFRESSQWRKESEPVNRWGVCAEYKLRPTRRGGLDEYFETQRRSHEYFLAAKHPHPLTNTKNWKWYKPLEETPDLFLKFARLSKQSNSANRALDWCEKYGVLGLNNDYHWGWSGGRQDSLEAFDVEVGQAAGILTLYQAALNGKHEEAKQTVLEEHPAISACLWAGGLRNAEWNTTLIPEMVTTHSNGDYLAYALEAASWLVETTVRKYCFPTLRPEGTADPAQLGSGWGFRNLLGAMYLQMYWLMASGGDVTRCKYCGLIVSLTTPKPTSGRKTRRDKQFCDDACRQRHHYHSKTKPSRQSKCSQ